MKRSAIGLAGLVFSVLVSVCSGDVRVVEPDGGESVISGQSSVIMWKCDSAVSSVRIEFSYTNGAVWGLVADGVPCSGGLGSYSWDVPILSSSECLVRISNAADLQDSDQSDHVFRIYSCELAMDFNGDCVVNLYDLAHFGDRWMSCGDPYDWRCTGNHAPVIVSVPVVVGQVGQSYVYNVEAKDTEGDVLSFDLPEKPEGMTIGEESGEISWRPGADQEGANQVVAQVSDSAGAADYQVFEVEVASLPEPEYEYTGVPVDGFPNLQERRMLVYTNAVRMAPVAYRDKYMIDNNPPPGRILEAYPAVPPVYYNRELNDAARYHSEDMAFNCGLRHDSCDGTSWYDRIIAFGYTGSPSGENVAYGFNGSRVMVNAFLCDAYSSTCAEDFGSSDGHRSNIMNSRHQEMGAGYVLKEGYPAPWYWTQDFGYRSLAVKPEIVSACHDFIDSGKTSFLLNYYDNSGQRPAAVRVVVNDEVYEMSLDIGTADRGTYRFDISRASECRSYYFIAIPADGEGWRYPGPGVFMTVGEGTCKDDYVRP